MQFSDEILMAYADGEVDADTRLQIEAAMTLDPTLAERIDKHRRLRTDLGAAFGGVLDEPIPARLLDAAGAPRAANSASITDLNAVRAAKQSGVNSEALVLAGMDFDRGQPAHRHSCRPLGSATIAVGTVRDRCR